MPSLSRSRVILISLAYLVAFIATDKLAFAFAIAPGVSLWYPPPGLTLALLLILGIRWLPLALAGSLLSAFIVYPMPQTWATVAMALNSSCSYALIAGAIRAWWGRPPRLDTMPHALGLAFVLLAAALPIACIGTWILQAVDLSAPDDFGRSVFRWWVGDTAGILSLVPALLVNVAPLLAPAAADTPVASPRTRRDVLELLAQTGSILASLAVLYAWPAMREHYLPYLSFVPLTWIVLRHGLPGAALGILAVNLGTAFVLKLANASEAILVSFLLFQFATTAMGFGLGAMVTSRARAEAERNRLLEIVEATPDFISTASLDGRVLYRNTALRALHGDRDGEIKPASLETLHPPWAAEKIMREGIPAALAHGRWSGETALLDAQGREIPVSQVIVPHRHPMGGAAALFAVARDISEQRKSEAERLERERRMLHTQKLESLGVLAGGIAHDFNNLLTTVLGNASLGRLELPTTSPVQQQLARIEQAALQAAELCQQMLAYSGKGQLEIASVDLSGLVRDIAHLIQVSIPKKATLHLDLAAQLPSVRGDATQLRQAVMNLVLNAVEAIGERAGEIRIATGALRADAALLATGVVTPPPEPGTYVYFEVIDEGHGMSAETRARIFEPFFTTKFTGHGLGLSAVLGIVRGHGGTLRVLSEIDQGARFRVMLPATDTPTTAPRAAAVPAATWRGTGTLLVVDDEETVRTVTATILERGGFAIETAANGAEALERFLSDPPRYRAVVLDILMPVLDGEQALEEMRRARPDLPALLMSGYSGRSGIVQSARAPTLFLTKPFRPDRLLGALRELLETRA